VTTTDPLGQPGGFALTGDGLLDDFRNCLYVCMRRLEGCRPNRLQYDIADFVSRGVDRGGSRFRFVEALRGEGKSLITSIYLPWRFLREFVINDGEIRTTRMVVSAGADRAENFTAYVQNLIQVIPAFQKLEPEDPNARWSLSAFDLRGKVPSHMPTVVSRPILGRMTGDRSDEIIFDDIEIPANAETEGQRQKVQRRALEFLDVLKPPVYRLPSGDEIEGDPDDAEGAVQVYAGGELVGLGAPQVEDSTYTKIHEWGFEVRMWPAEYPDPAWMSKHGHRLAPMLKDGLESGEKKAGEPTDPSRFGRRELDVKRNAGRSRYALQYMLDTSLADAERYPLKCRDLVVMDLDPHVGPEYPVWAGSEEYRHEDLACVGLSGDRFQRPMLVRDDRYVPYDYKGAALDPAGKGKDEMAYAIGGAIGAFRFIHEVGAIEGGYEDDALAPFVDKLAEHRVTELAVEANFGGGSVEAVVGRLVRKKARELREAWEKGGRTGPEPWGGCSIEMVTHRTQKELRIIDSIEPVANQHRLVVSRSVVERDKGRGGEGGEAYRLFHQWTRLTKDRGCLTRDDRLDAVAILNALMTDRGDVEQDEHVAQKLAEEREEMWRHYWEHALPQHAPARPGPSWGEASTPALDWDERYSTP